MSLKLKYGDTLLLPEMQPVFDFALAWLKCEKDAAGIVVRYNPTAQRADVMIKTGDIEFEVCYEPGYPVQNIKDSWQPAP